MFNKKRARLFARRPAVALSLAAAVVATALPPLVQAQPPADDCIQLFIWRQARPSDHVCVGGGMAHEVFVQNLNPTANQVSGSNTCVSGFVWREAFDGDTVCVTPDFRAQVRADNAAAASRVAPVAKPQNSKRQVHFAIETFNTSELGSYQISQLGIDERWDSTAPWSKDVTIGPDTTSLDLKGWAAHKVRCTIDVDGVRVASNEGSFVWCKWKAS